MVVRSTPARATHPQHIGYLRVRVTHVGGVFNPLGYKFDGKLPAGANIVGVHSNIIAAFTGGTITLGATGAPTELVTSITPLTPGAKTVQQPNTTFAIPTVDYDPRIFVTVAVVGDGEFTIYYVPTRL